MSQIPRDNFDSTLALLTDGYEFISKGCARHNADVFQTRLLLQKTICLRGEEAAELFYDTSRFQRQGAAPKRLQKTLLGEGGVQGLDDEAHRHRKAMLMSLMGRERIDELVLLMRNTWHSYLAKWAQMDEAVLFDELRELLCCAVCQWAGVPLPAREVELRTRQLGALIDGAGAVGLAHWRGRWARDHAERWVGGLIEQVRNGQLAVDEERALHVIATHRKLNGELLETHAAAVDLLNVLRPTVAVGRFITFAALALHEHPATRQNLQANPDDYVELFVQEVRRYYPFFPFATARVRHDFEWRGYRFPQGTRVLLDLYGTDHDARLWPEPEMFRPERFRERPPNAFNLIPQGGGDYVANHRCAGEWITLALMQEAVHLLTSAMTYDVPPQDLRIDRSTLPALPQSRFVVTNVRPV